MQYDGIAAKVTRSYHRLRERSPPAVFSHGQGGLEGIHLAATVRTKVVHHAAADRVRLQPKAQVLVVDADRRLRSAQRRAAPRRPASSG